HPLASRKIPHPLPNRVTPEQEAPQQGSHLDLIRGLVPSRRFGQNRPVWVQVLQFLGKEGAPSQVAVDTAFYRLQLPQEKTQQGGLSGAVGADHQHPVPSLDGEGRSAKK